MFLMVAPNRVAAQSEGESKINSEYHDQIISYIKEDLLKKEKQIAKQAERILVNLPNEYKLYDETFVKIHLDVEEGTKEDGTLEYDLVYSIAYTCKHL